MEMEKNKVEKQLEINPIFEPLFLDNVDDPRYYQLYGGRGSGKSYVASIAAVRKTFSKFKHKILYLRQTMTSSEDSTIADVREAIRVLKYEKYFREKSGVITNIVTGATISFKGIRSAGSQTAKLKSLSGITTLIVEEAEEVESFEEFSKIDESIRIANKPLKVILIYNPTSSIKSWIHDEWFVNGKPKVERYQDTVYLHSTYLDNLENLNPSIVKRYEDLKITNPVYYRNTILAEWTLGVEGRIYDGWGIYPTFEEEGDIWYGLDFGYGGNDKTSCIKINYFDGVYYIKQMFSKAKLSIRQTLTEMRNASIPYNAKIFADSAMPLLIEEIRSGGYGSIRKARKGNVEAGIKKVQDKDIVLIDDKTNLLYDSYMTFRRDKKGKLPHEPDELAALRYGINSKRPIKDKGKVKKRRVRKAKGYL